MNINYNKCGINIVYNKSHFSSNFEHKLKVAFSDSEEIITGLYNLINLIKINDNKKQKNFNN